MRHRPLSSVHPELTPMLQTATFGVEVAFPAATAWAAGQACRGKHVHLRRHWRGDRSGCSSPAPRPA